MIPDILKFETLEKVASTKKFLKMIIYRKHSLNSHVKKNLENHTFAPISSKSKTI